MIRVSRLEREPMSDAVTVEYGDGVIEITINRPEARNALNGAVRTGVTEALAELDARDDLAIAILTGAGGTFSAGMDLKAFLAGELSGEPGRGMAGLTPVPPHKAGHRRRRGLRAGGRLRARPGLRPAGRRRQRHLRHPRGQ